ncbi:MAG TPA: MGMT family protein [Methanobacteriaceae archaeon]|nr:MGMT family protein [Methanobacteriaceae archaeon]
MKVKIIKPTPFGIVAIAWSEVGDSPLIARILISSPDLSAEDQVSQIYPHFEIDSCEEIDEITSQIKSFLEGDDISFSLDLVDWKMCTSFQKAVLRAEYQIPRGMVSTYQLVAQQINKKNGARAVGNALARNPFPIMVPCHRAIRSDGYLGGFQGGVDMKRMLLENEGIIFDDMGRMLSSQFHYNDRNR